MSTSELEATQNTYEQRFNCIVCLSPRLHMVSGLCQHRVCEDCLYQANNIRRPSFDKCPTCLIVNMFPLLKPDIPEDNIEHQKCLGVRACPHEGCDMEMWEWEVEEHLQVCPNRIKTKNRGARRSLPADCRDNKKAKLHSTQRLNSLRKRKSVHIPETQTVRRLTRSSFSPPQPS